MKKLTILLICLLMAATILPSCVSKRRYLAARARADKMDEANAELHNRVRAQADSINQLGSQLSALGDVNETEASELNMSKEQIAAQRERLHQLENFISAQQKAVSDLRKKMADALVGFNSSDLTVTMKNGKVYVSMQEKLLFPSGSAEVNPGGKDALSKIAGVLNYNPDINVEVEGNTDSVPIHTKMYPDNWALSVARATAISKILINDYQVSPAKLVASGRSQYNPVADNSTPDGRALNRRTDIILEPKLDELMQLLNQPFPTATTNK
jgi:chemotaxis protein MotB